ncbi:MAG: hypothetical protein ACJ73S_25920 [Mycobacteriales bacterium]
MTSTGRTPTPTAFKRRLLAELTQQIPANGSTARPRRDIVSGRAVTGRRLALAASGVAAAGAALAVGLPALLGSAGPRSVSTPAWAVRTTSDGSIDITIRDTTDPTGLQRTLNAAGIPAVVRAGNPSCRTWAVDGEPESYRVITEDEPVDGQTRFQIHPKALRRGHYVGILIMRGNAGGAGDDGQVIIETSVIAVPDPPCTTDQRLPEQLTGTPIPR